MADSTPPLPLPPAPGQGAADAPLLPIEAASAATTPKKPAARKPAAARGASTSVAPASAEPASAESASAAPAPVEIAPVQLAPSPYAAQPAMSAYSSLPTAAPSTLSVLALVLGITGLIFSFFLLGLLPAIGGVILGHLALKREPHARGMAIAGLATGYVGIAISVLWGFAILIPTLLFFFAISGLAAGGFGG